MACFVEHIVFLKTCTVHNLNPVLCEPLHFTFLGGSAISHVLNGYGSWEMLLCLYQLAAAKKNDCCILW